MKNKTILWLLMMTLTLGMLSCASPQASDADIYIDPQATYVNITKVTEDAATLDVDFDVINATGASHDVKTIVEIYKNDHKIQQQASTLALQDTTALTFSFDIPNPDLGSPDAPELYLAKITLKSSWRVLDKYEQPFELYTFDFISVARPFTLAIRSNTPQSFSI